MTRAKVYLDLSLDDWGLVQNYAEREFPEVKDSRERNKAAIRRIIRLWCSGPTTLQADVADGGQNKGQAMAAVPLKPGR